MSKIPPTLTRGKARLWEGSIPGTHEPGYVELPIIEIGIPPEVHRLVHGDLDLELHRFRFGSCTIMLGHEPSWATGELRWHLTISHPDRHPTWDEIKTARYRLCGPDTVMAMILPPAAQYVNVEDHVMQLWEIADAAQVNNGNRTKFRCSGRSEP